MNLFIHKNLFFYIFLNFLQAHLIKNSKNYPLPKNLYGFNYEFFYPIFVFV